MTPSPPRWKMRPNKQHCADNAIEKLRFAGVFCFWAFTKRDGASAWAMFAPLILDTRQTR